MCWQQVKQGGDCVTVDKRLPSEFNRLDPRRRHHVQGPTVFRCLSDMWSQRGMAAHWKGVWDFVLLMFHHGSLLTCSHPHPSTAPPSHANMSHLPQEAVGPNMFADHTPPVWIRPFKLAIFNTEDVENSLLKGFFCHYFHIVWNLPPAFHSPTAGSNNISHALMGGGGLSHRCLLALAAPLEHLLCRITLLVLHAHTWHICRKDDWADEAAAPTALVLDSSWPDAAVSGRICPFP